MKKACVDYLNSINGAFVVKAEMFLYLRKKNLRGSEGSTVLYISCGPMKRGGKGGRMGAISGRPLPASGPRRGGMAGPTSIGLGANPCKMSGIYITTLLCLIEYVI